MSNLTIVNRDGVLLTDSREVAAMVDKRHDHLKRDIDGYVEILKNSDAPKIGVVDFFIESTYLDGKGEERPCYLITRKGCDMIANRSVFNKSCSDAQINSRALLGNLRARGLIQTRGKGFTKSKRINGVYTDCVVMRLPNDESDITHDDDLSFDDVL